MTGAERPQAGIAMLCKGCGWKAMGATNLPCPDCGKRLNFISWKDGERDMAMSILAQIGVKLDTPEFACENPFPRWDPKWIERNPR